jgi:hypothetical protein
MGGMMRITIWQQFSSNHSSFFSITGTFKTFQEAQLAYDELRRILFEIDEWHRQYPAESKAAYQINEPRPTPPESKIANEYQIEWVNRIDWAAWANYYLVDHSTYRTTLTDLQRQAEYLIDKAVLLAAKQVEFESPDETWMSPTPFIGIMKRLGAEVTGIEVISGDPKLIANYDLTPIVVFTAPDEATADRLESELRNYFSSFPAGTKPFADLNEALSSYFTPKDAYPPWMGHENNLLPTSLVRKDAIEQARRAEKSNLELGTKVNPNLHRSKEWLLVGLGRPPESFGREGLQFRTGKLHFKVEAIGLPIFLAYLEANGCTIDVEYVRTPIKLD